MKKIKLLYAEDETKTRKNHIRFLQSRYDFEIFEASDGKEAFEIYEKERPDIVLTDIMMPGIDGLELAKQIRNISKETKIIIITAFTEQEKLLKAFEYFVLSYIVKPLDRQKLQESLEMALSTLPKNTCQNDANLVYITKNSYFDKTTKEFFLDENRVRLSRSETLLLEILIKNKNNALDEYDIFIHVWDEFEKEFSSDSVRALVKKLRKKLPPGSIENIYGGYYKINTIE